MELCLYDPELGYYARNAAQFGKAGDFYTSSDVHAVFGRLLARQFDEMWRALGSPDHLTLIELGPGRGLFAQDVLDWSEKKFPDFFRALHCVLVERSPALRHRIGATLSHHMRSGKAELAASAFSSALEDNSQSSKENDLSDPEKEIPSGPVAERQKTAAHGASRGSESQDDKQASKGRKKIATDPPTILFANEFFDALPVEILSTQGSLRIDARNNTFVETWTAPSSEELEFLDSYSVHPEAGERVEVPMAAQHYADRVFATIDRGFFIAIDYGYTREEQLAGRYRGTLKVIRRHSVSANPYEAPGEQDITADVNFTALTAVAEKHGMQAQKLITQAQFLMGIGEANQFADAFEDCRLPQERAKVALQLKHLVTPAGMGESFHVLASSKGVDLQTASNLAGLTFARR